MNKEIEFTNFPLSDMLMETCEHGEKCYDVCAGSCLICGIVLDILLICPRFIIYKCNCNCNCKCDSCINKNTTTFNTINNNPSISENKKKFANSNNANNANNANNYIKNEPK